jgi:hypothetical protein
MVALPACAMLLTAFVATLPACFARYKQTLPRSCALSDAYNICEEDQLREHADALIELLVRS